MKEHEKALSDANRAVELGPDEEWPYRSRAAVYRDMGELDKALADLEKAVELDSSSHSPRYYQALLCLEVEDLVGYRKACAAMLRQFADSNNAEELHFTTWMCALAPNALDDHSLAIELAERVVELDSSKRQYLGALGANLYRTGQFEEAIERLVQADQMEVTAKTSPAYTWYFLALTHHKLGHEAEGRQWFEKAVAWTERVLDESRDDYEPVFWDRRMTLELLHNESARVLGMPNRDNTQPNE